MMIAQRPILSVVVPAFNEEEIIVETIEKIVFFLNQSSWSFELIVVDDGSADRTAKIVTDNYKGVRLIRHEANRGKGAAVRSGVEVALGEWILICDADLATPIEELDKLWRWRDKYELIIGSRYLEASNILKKQVWQRRIVSRLGNWYIQMVLLPGIQDTQCGFKLLSAKVAKEIFPDLLMSGWSFDLEILARARKKGYQIKEVAIDWYDRPRGRIRLVRDSWQVFWDVIKIKFI